MPNDQLPQQSESEVRQPYAAPRLVAYGLVRELTAGGSKGTPEVGGPQPGHASNHT